MAIFQQFQVFLMILQKFVIFIAIYGNFATISTFSHDFAFYRFFPSDMGPYDGIPVLWEVHTKLVLILKALMPITFSSPRAQPEVVYFLVSNESPYFSNCKSEISPSNSL